ncbi:hypothetical protein [Hahella ganghwensis]|uniref:hypothetical protein n=1 Tax=Hahella ganghwensis TaxID=286420 RepID=UPI00037FD8C8|nr:hypothetical protein [Hahella ganghwensis]
MKTLSASDLLAGGELIHEIEIPDRLLASDGEQSPGSIRLRPLTVKDLQLISRAAKENDGLTSALMIQTSLVEPRMELTDVYRLPIGLMNFLLDEVNRISGIGASEAELHSAAEDPLVKAAFILAREFGWTPEQVSDLTLGQLMLNLQLLKEKAATG